MAIMVYSEERTTKILEKKNSVHTLNFLTDESECYVKALWNRIL